MERGGLENDVKKCRTAMRLKVWGERSGTGGPTFLPRKRGGGVWKWRGEQTVLLEGGELRKQAPTRRYAGTNWKRKILKGGNNAAIPPENRGKSGRQNGAQKKLGGTGPRPQTNWCRRERDHLQCPSRKNARGKARGGKRYPTVVKGAGGIGGLGGQNKKVSTGPQRTKVGKGRGQSQTGTGEITLEGSQKVQCKAARSGQPLLRGWSREKKAPKEPSWVGGGGRGYRKESVLYRNQMIREERDGGVWKNQKGR